MTELRSVWRSLIRSPGFAGVATLTLAIGIGSSTAIFSLVSAVLLQPLPFHEPDRLVQLSEVNIAEREEAGVSMPNFNDWRTQSRTFDEMALMLVEATPWVMETSQSPEQARITLVSPNLFPLLGVRPALGRDFSRTPGSIVPDSDVEVILSHSFWMRAFGGDLSVIGRSVRVEGDSGNVIVGVMPAGVAVPEGTDFWMPIDVSRFAAGERGVHAGRVIGRLKPDVSLDTARAELASIAGALSTEHPATNAGWSVRLMAMQEASVSDHRLALWLLMGATTMVMLIGCANVSNLLLARGVTRRVELAVRAALGAGRSRLVRLLLLESLLLSTAGGIVGLLLVWAGLPLLVYFGSATVPRLAEAHLSTPVATYCALAAVVTALLSGLAPALQASRTDLRKSMVRVGFPLQHAILGGQLALCLVLVFGAILFVRTLVNLRTTELGFVAARVVSIDARFPMHRSMERNRWQMLSRDTVAALAHMRGLPGIKEVSAVNYAPLSGTMVPVAVTIGGESRRVRASYKNVTPGFFRTLGIPLVAGRDFSDADVSDLARLPDPDAVRPREGAVILNDTAARQFFPGETALGQLLSTEYDSRGVSGRRVVGIVRDLRSMSVRDEAPAEVYVPYLEDPSFAFTLLIRTSMPPERLGGLLKDELRRVIPDLSVANARTLDEVVIRSLGSVPLSTIVVSVFATVALGLSAIGIFSVFAFSVASRAREMGVRVALGATGGDVIRLFLSHALRPIAAGAAMGGAAALLTMRAVSSLLYGVAPTDPVSLGFAIAAMTAVAFTASYLPVRRALSRDPSAVLRDL